MKKIAVLITVHNRKDKTLLCLQKLYAQILAANYEIELYLVNDGSTDGTTEAVQYKYPQVHIIEGDGNLFWNRGMHLAWKTARQHADYDYYLWLNDDTELYRNSLGALIKVSNDYFDQSIIVGTTSESNQIEKYTYGGRNKEGKLIHPNHEALKCEFFNGNIVLVPRFVFEKVGFNDPIFHHALGDFDFGLRSSKLNISSYIAPGVLGSCSAHTSHPTWCNPQKSLKERWKAFRTPLGQNPEEFFIFELRHKGLYYAFLHYITNHIRMFCPSLWNKESI